MTGASRRYEQRDLVLYLSDKAHPFVGVVTIALPNTSDCWVKFWNKTTQTYDMCQMAHNNKHMFYIGKLPAFVEADDRWETQLPT